MKNKIKNYIKENGTEVLGIDSVESMEIKEKISGAYNMNYPVIVNDKELLFRISPIKGKDVKEYEYMVLKVLEEHNVAPKPHHLDTTEEKLEYPFLIEEWLGENYLERVSGNDIEKLAELFHKIHSIKDERIHEGMFSLRGFIESITHKLNKYTHNRPFKIDYFYDIEEIVPPVIEYLEEKENLFKSKKYPGLSSTDMKPWHIIRTEEGLKVVDWENATLDDDSHDLGDFLFHLMWNHEEYSEDLKEELLERYEELSGDKHISEKVEVRMVTFAIKEALWCMRYISDLKSNKVPASMREEEDLDNYREIVERNLDWLSDKLNLGLEFR